MKNMQKCVFLNWCNKLHPTELPLTNKGGDRKLITQTHRLRIAEVAVGEVVVVRGSRAEGPAVRAGARALHT